jgi:hypothetical protein
LNALTLLLALLATVIVFIAAAAIIVFAMLDLSAQQDQRKARSLQRPVLKSTMLTQ